MTKYKNTITYLLILIGGGITLYANVNEKQNIFILIFGVILLMFGLYKLNTSLSSKPPKNDYIINEEEE